MIGLTKEFFSKDEVVEEAKEIDIKGTGNSGSYADYGEKAVPKGSMKKVPEEAKAEGSGTKVEKGGKGPHFAQALAPKKLKLDASVKKANATAKESGDTVGDGPDGIPKESLSR